MDFKKLFRKDEKAVSPVIGVILMVAITVILAAAIGSSVFSQGTTKSAPQANLNIKPTDTGVIIEHLGGDEIDFAKSNITMFDGTKYFDYDDKNVTTGTLSAGEFIAVGINDPVDKGKIISIKVTDETTNQLICDKNVRFITKIEGTDGEKT